MRMSEEEYNRLQSRRGVTPPERQAISSEMQELINKANAKAKAPLEDQEQVALVNWLKIRGIRYHATPNGGHRHVAVAKKLKAQGVQAGVPDLTIWPDVDGCQPILWIELKRTKGGSVSEEQRNWIDYLNEIGWRHDIKAAVCKGFQEAREFILACGY